MLDHTPSTMLDPSGMLVKDCMCRRCGYNLRGLPESGRCPECGTPIGASIRGDLLQFADPEWLEKVGRGLTIIMWMILVGFVIGAVAGFLGLVSPALSALIGLAAAVVSYYGAWLMTKPDPSGFGESGQWNARKVLRVTLVIGMLGNLMTLFARQTPPSGGTLGVLFGGALLFGLVGIAGEFAKFYYYEGLARRIPDQAIADRARLLRWGYSVSMIGVTIAAAIAIFSMRRPTAQPHGAAIGSMACIGVISGVAFFVFSIMAIFLLIRLRRSVVEQARLARESWAAASA